MTHIPYVYRLTDRETGKRYIGSRYSRVCEPVDLGVKYFTSSKTVTPLFKADPDRFEKQIIVTGTREYVIKVEHDLIELYDAVMSEEFYNRTNQKAIHPDDSGSKLGGARCKELGVGVFKMTKDELRTAGKKGGPLGGARQKELGLIQALGRTGAGGRATKGMPYKQEQLKVLHSVKDENGKSVVAVRAGKSTAAGGTLSASGKIAGRIAVDTGQLRSVASKGGSAAGAKCKAEGLGVCGFTLEERQKWGSISGAIVGKMPWWVDPLTRKTKRSLSQPDGFVPGRKIK